MKITSESKCSKVSSTTGWRDGEAAAAERAGNEGLLEEVTSALLEVLRGALQVVGAERAKAREKEPLLVARKIHFILLFSRQGKLRLQKWYTTLPDKERKKITREIVHIVLSRGQRTSSFVDWKELKLVYKRYASLYFCCAVENQDNELLTLEIVHRYVELLDKYFGNVCELDIIFNFEKAYFILDEFIIGGEIQETSKKSAVKAIEDSDMLQETMEEYMNKPTF
ncbi:AP-1 complex subunit sigma-3 [Neophocaena asiaeorientalis asiaeorientalis]|uniref:AP-1 complex subunit sigma-3 n=1 Tax=Neophocaena asiaeorientalis asiaeorientalis TaxID=1706337 RepID=A0A341CX13_NEOAA|nr:AP-1 complex subunit sigma-3 [Neophocaena asiaeorientalis asiaeorientalis]